MKQIFLILGLFFCLSSFGQLKPVGSWTDHLPYQSGTSIATDGVLIYCATQTGLFTFNSVDNSIQTFSKVNLLNDINISEIAYSKQASSLVIVYENSNIDILKAGRITNLPFLKNSTQSQKFINEIKIQGTLAYLSFGFGIMVIDLEKVEIVDTYKFGPNGNAINVNSTEIVGPHIFAATSSGIYQAELVNNLLDFNAWDKIPFKASRPIFKLFKNQFLNIIVDETGDSDSAFYLDNNQYLPIDSISGKTYKAFSETINNQYIYYGSQEVIFLDTLSSFVRRYNFNNRIVVGGQTTLNNRYFILNSFDPLIELDNNSSSIKLITKPNGPFEKSIFDIEVSKKYIWSVGGRHTSSYNNGFNGARVYRYDKFNWVNYINFHEPSLADVFDMVSVTINPQNENEVYFGSWSEGLIRLNDQPPFQIFGLDNSSLQQRDALPGWVGVSETEFDDNGNLWVSNTFTNNCLSVRKANGNWKSFNFSDFLKSPETAIYDLLIDDNGYKWLALERDNALLVFDDKGTIDNISDDETILLTSEVGNGAIPGVRGLIMELDKDGALWLGTSDGIAVHYNPSNIFESGSKDFQRIIVFDGENNEIVLENANITALAIDGANQKWIGTDNSGVLLLSEDGKETLLEFNVDNSPLFSNSINAITIDDFTGEVYIATAEGLLSYRATATEGSENFSNINVFPNPVRSNYEGSITIQGLVANSTVKITDVSGTLINEIKSQGGTVVWDGNNFNGRRASTGVYLLFMSGEDEEGDLKTEIGKIMFVN